MDGETRSTFPFVLKIFNGLLLLITLILGVVVFFAILDMVFIISTAIVARTTTDATVQESYIVINIRNIWVFLGGILLLAFLIVGIDYHTKRLSNNKTSRILLWTLLIEFMVIGISLLSQFFV